MRKYSILILFIILLPLLIYNVGCTSPSLTPTQQCEVVLRTWEDDMPMEPIEEFSKNYQIPVRVVPYESYEEAAEDIEAGSPGDVIALDSSMIPGLIANHALAPIDRTNIPNFRYISPAFRDPSFDPGNLYTIPYQWGTSGIVYRSDLTGREITHWRDMWNPAFAGKVGLWKGEPRDVIGLTLKMLGYSANTENPDEVAEAIAELKKLASHVQWVESFDPYTPLPGLIDGRLIISHGYAYDELEGKQYNPNIKYVLPAEGSVLWDENFVISAASVCKKESELFINFLLEPSVMVKIVLYNHFAPMHDEAIRLLPPEIKSDYLIFPPEEDLEKAELIYPLSEQAEQLYSSLWEEFVSSVSGEIP